MFLNFSLFIPYKVDKDKVLYKIDSFSYTSALSLKIVIDNEICR